MRSVDIPAKFPIPFANNAGGSYIWTVPKDSQIGITDGRASLHDGFVPDNFIPIGAGGVPPFGKDFNGLLNQVTAWNRWQAAGGVPVYDSQFSTDIGGYPAGCMLGMAAGGGFWLCTVDNNVTDPDTGGSGWIGFYPYEKQTLLANANYYVNPSTGSDANNGLAAVSGGGNGPWATLQHAWNVIQGKLDLGGFTVTVHCAAGTYGSLIASGQVAGQNGEASIVFTGDLVTPSNCVITENGDAVSGVLGARFTVTGFRILSSTQSAIYPSNSSIAFGKIEFGACGFSHIRADQFGYCYATDDYKIVGSAPDHFFCDNATIAITNRIVTLTGTPNFSTAFASVETGGIINAGAVTFVGSATGPRYLAVYLGGIITQNAGANYFPGNSAGSTNTGGQYF